MPLIESGLPTLIPILPTLLYFCFWFRNACTSFASALETSTHIRNRFSLYWICQLTGWGITSLYWALQSALSGPFDYAQALLHFAGDVLVGIALTHVYRRFAMARGWQHLGPRALVGRLLGAVLILGVLYMLLIALKLYAVRWLLIPGFGDHFWTFFTSTWLPLLATGVRLMAIWLLAWHLYQYAQREIRSTKHNAQLAIMAREAQLSKLSAQLNPHFFFNALNTVKFLVNANPVAARRAIDLLSDLLRHSLYLKDDLLVPLSAELGLVRDYLELEKLRFEERLQIQMNVPDSLPQVQLPPLSLQLLAENAIKHGIDRLADGGVVQIDAAVENDFLKLRVQNPGTLNTQGTPGLGLRNLRERLRLQYHDAGSLELRQLPNTGVEACLIIPLS